MDFIFNSEAFCQQVYKYLFELDIFWMEIKIVIYLPV